MLIDIQTTMKFAAELKKLLHLGETAKHAGRVLVLDGADIVGYRVVERLIDAEFIDLRVGMRTLSEKEETQGVELVPFVWEDETTYDEALKGIKTVFVTLPLKPLNWDTHFPAFLKACKANHVARIIKLSFYHAIRSKAENPVLHYGSPEYVATHDGFHDVPLIHKHALCDGDIIVRHQELSAIILFASHLMSNVFRCAHERNALKDKQEFYGASCGKGVNYVSPNDIADVAVKIIFDKTHQRQALTLTGPSFVTDEEVATLLTDTFGTKVSYIEKPLDFFDEDTAALEKLKATGLEEHFPKGDTMRILGRDPEKFEDYLKATDRMTPVEQEIISILSGQEVEPTPFMGTLTFRQDTGVTENAEQPTETTKTTQETELPVTPRPTRTTDESIPFLGNLDFRDEIESSDTGVEVVEKEVSIVTPDEAPTTAAQ